MIEYTLPDVPTAEASLPPRRDGAGTRPGPAEELAALYYERWQMKTAFDEFKTYLRGGQRVRRSKTPELVRQEAWGFLLAQSRSVL